jgi:hypothetical protein
VQAQVGDMIVLQAHKVGTPDRKGEVLEVHGTDGEPPWVVRWDDNGHASTFFPGTDCIVQHLATT